MQHEIIAPSALLDGEGNLVQRGWARRPLLDCNLENASFYKIKPAQFLRIKRWDYYAVFTPTHFISATIADIGYAGNIFLYFVDFTKPWYHEEGLLTPFGKSVTLPRNSTEGASHFDNGKVRVSFTLEAGTRHLAFASPGFDDGQGFEADIQLTVPPAHEAVVMATPIGQKRFYYNHKINCLPASGWFEYAGECHELDPSTCLGGLDWGCGVWEYKSFWNWASASAYLPDGRTFGLNIGEGFGDLSRATENAFILDGRVHKLDRIPFEYDSNNYMKPSHFASTDQRLDLTFTPFLDRTAISNLLVITSEVHQMFGRYEGWIITDEGSRIEIRDVIGFAEEHHAKW